MYELIFCKRLILLVIDKERSELCFMFITLAKSVFALKSRFHISLESTKLCHIPHSWHRPSLHNNGANNESNVDIRQYYPSAVNINKNEEKEGRAPAACSRFLKIVILSGIIRGNFFYLASSHRREK